MSKDTKYIYHVTYFDTMLKADRSRYFTDPEKAVNFVSMRLGGMGMYDNFRIKREEMK